jgi:hypothetical protein
MTHTTILTTPSEREIVSERTYAAPRERVWEAFTDPELIPRWWGPRRMSTIVDRLDVRVGGEWRLLPEGLRARCRGPGVGRGEPCAEPRRKGERGSRGSRPGLLQG